MARGKRVLVVEDELMIRMLLQDMLDDLGHTLAGEAGRIDEALTLAKQGEFDVAILDVNLNGQPISPVVEMLVERGLPFVFATGYGQRGVPEPIARRRRCRSRSRRMRWRKRSRRRRRRAELTSFSRNFFNRRVRQACVMYGSSVMSSRSGVTAMQ